MVWRPRAIESVSGYCHLAGWKCNVKEIHKGKKRKEKRKKSLKHKLQKIPNKQTNKKTTKNPTTNQQTTKHPLNKYI